MYACEKATKQFTGANTVGGRARMGTDESPTHVAMVWNGSSAALFINGHSSLSESLSPDFVSQIPKSVKFPNLSIWLGGREHREKRGHPTNLNLHAYRISSTARYSDDFQPIQSFEADEHTVALYHFDEGQGDVLHDSSGNNHHGKIVGAKWVRIRQSDYDRTPASVSNPADNANAPPFAVAPFDKPQAKAHQEAWAKHLGEPVVTTNSIGMKLAVIPPGRFKMGEDDAKVDVTLTQPFRMGVHEVTQGQWKVVMRTEPWGGQENMLADENVAATFVSGDDANEFCRRLTETERKAGNLRDDREYRLPTEAEWEYACRAGTTTRFSFGDEVSKLGEYAWYKANAEGIGENHAHAVGEKRANPWGLHDVHGNVREWCSDWHGEALPGGTDPTGSTEGSLRVCRGGFWRDDGGGCRSAYRNRSNPSNRIAYMGFRLVLAPVAGNPMTEIGSSVTPPGATGTASNPLPAVASFNEVQTRSHQKARTGQPHSEFRGETEESS